MTYKMVYHIKTSYNVRLMLCRKDGMGKRKWVIMLGPYYPMQKKQACPSWKIYNKQVVAAQEKSKQNAIVDASQLAQTQRLLNTLHYMVQSDTLNRQFEMLCVLELANGADLGCQYYNDKTFAEFLNLIWKQFVML